MEREQPQVYSVSQITRLVKGVIESSFGPVGVRGEISNYVLHSSGHRYFSLKDEGALLNCVMFRSAGAALRFEPEDGMLVEARGSLTVYERGGRYQLRVDEMAPAGVGSLQQAFEALKKKLSEEGLFDEKHKKPLPRFPRTVGVVTSPTGAAIRDILRVMKRRAPYVGVVLKPVRVQGEGAAEEIARAIELFDSTGIADLLIVGRGGGSLEDLWAFNEERVARAIFSARVPVISAVGHEIDFTLSDFVADVRAPTPSAAAEIAVRDNAELLTTLERERARLEAAIRRAIGDRRARVNALATSYGLRRPLDLLREGAQRVDELRHSIGLQWASFLARERQRIEHCRERLRSLDPHAILERGYCICTREADGATVTSSSQLRAGDGVSLLFRSGSASASVVRTSGDGEERGTS